MYMRCDTEGCTDGPMNHTPEIRLCSTQEVFIQAMNTKWEKGVLDVQSRQTGLRTDWLGGTGQTMSPADQVQRTGRVT